MQDVIATPVDYVPTKHSVQSVSLVAAVLSATEPAVQLLVEQDVLAPVSEYVPGEQLVHPSVAVVAAPVVEY